MRRAAAIVLRLALLLWPLALVGCGKPSIEERTRVNEEGGYRYVIPPQWREVQGEVRSPANTLVSVQVVSLDYGDDAFIAGLPRTVLPQLEAWSRKLYVVVDRPTETPTTVGGEPALEAVYPVRTRPEDPLGHVAYWVVRHGQNLFVLRAAYPPGAEAKDEGRLRELLASWHFIGPAGAAGQTASGVTTPSPGR